MLPNDASMMNLFALDVRHVRLEVRRKLRKDGVQICAWLSSGARLPSCAQLSVDVGTFIKAQIRVMEQLNLKLMARWPGGDPSCAEDHPPDLHLSICG